MTDYIYVNDGTGGIYRKGQLGPIGQYTDGVDWRIEVRNLHNEVMGITDFDITAAMTDRATGAVTNITGAIMPSAVTEGLAVWTIVEADSDAAGLYDAVFTLTDGAVTYISLPVALRITENSVPIFTGAYDDIPNLAYIWETRRTLTSYTEPLGQLRRASDGTLKNVDATDLGHFNAALAAQFIGASTGFWRQLYEQKGTGNNLAQSTNSRQPLYNANITNGRPGLEQTTTTQGLIDTSAPITQPATIYIVAKLTAAAVNDGVTSFLAADSGSQSLIYDNAQTTPDSFTIQQSATGMFGPASDADWHLWTITFNGASSSLRLDGVEVATANLANINYTGVVLGNWASMNLGWRGLYGAMIVADPAHDAAQIATMEAAINAYWSIY